METKKQEKQASPYKVSLVDIIVLALFGYAAFHAAGNYGLHQHYTTLAACVAYMCLRFKEFILTPALGLHVVAASQFGQLLNCEKSFVVATVIIFVFGYDRHIESEKKKAGTTFDLIKNTALGLFIATFTIVCGYAGKPYGCPGLFMFLGLSSIAVAKGYKEKAWGPLILVSITVAAYGIGYPISAETFFAIMAFFITAGVLAYKSMKKANDQKNAFHDVLSEKVKAYPVDTNPDDIADSLTQKILNELNFSKLEVEEEVLKEMVVKYFKGRKIMANKSPESIK